jgi:hypothetical protein
MIYLISRFFVSCFFAYQGKYGPKDPKHLEIHTAFPFISGTIFRFELLY